jgi:long-chain acyl-CoA synthetase
VAHETHGQEVVACVVLAADASVENDTLVEFVREKVAAYKFPRRIEVVDALPLGASGKVLKRELVARYEEGARVE